MSNCSQRSTPFLSLILNEDIPGQLLTQMRRICEFAFYLRLISGVLFLQVAALSVALFRALNLTVRYGYSKPEKTTFVLQEFVPSLYQNQLEIFSLVLFWFKLFMRACKHLQLRFVIMNSWYRIHESRFSVMTQGIGEVACVEVCRLIYLMNFILSQICPKNTFVVFSWLKRPFI